MPFLQLTFELGSIEPDTLEEACLSAGALAVTFTDAADTPVLEPDPGATPLWPQVRAAVLFDGGADRDAILQALTRALGRSLPGATFQEIPDKAWEREWMADFKPMRFGQRLWICPQGMSVPQADAVVVQLDPGLAFGTGTHATTAMCLQWLDGADLANKEVIDYGCGSGVLAIAALKLGARRAYAVDHDPQALAATRENAERNEVSARIEVLDPTSALPQADLLLANILVQPLIELAPRFQSLVKDGGELVLSGILTHQSQAVLGAYERGFSMRVARTREEWALLHGSKTPHPVLSPRGALR